MNTLRSGSRSANQLRQLKQLLNRHSTTSSSHARRAISTARAPPSFLRQHSIVLPDHLSPRHPIKIQPSYVTAFRHLHTGGGDFGERYENQAPKTQSSSSSSTTKAQEPERLAHVVVSEIALTLIDEILKFKPIRKAEGKRLTDAINENCLDQLRQEEFFAKLEQILEAKRERLMINIVDNSKVHGDESELVAHAFAATKITIALKAVQKIKEHFPPSPEAEEAKRLTNKIVSEVAEELIDGRAKVDKTVMAEVARVGKEIAEELDNISGEEDIVKVEQILTIERERLMNNILANSKVDGDETRLIGQGITAKLISMRSKTLKNVKEKHIPAVPEDINLKIQKVASRRARLIEFVPQEKAFVVERSGKYWKTLESGTRHFLNPFTDRIAYEYSLEQFGISFPRQIVATKGNFHFGVDGRFGVRVVNPKLASYGVDNPTLSVIQTAKSKMRIEFSKITMHEFTHQRDTLLENITKATNDVAKDWGMECVVFQVYIPK
ncbi:OLC1v1001801C1 [Oldenlandia corymbosa var. corymbosa]|uniref:OLC1v1001801C1 n=1 Tax=Oldenlandia corymbosa var. corymbosa TaxID=529605 RepID=A0AAV1D6T6_OLDCO|nr:OLC1v1001801C1 [Oldenlandia corymbosa var. corymbosa]